MRNIKLILILLTTFIFTSCEMFNYSPYTTNVDDDQTNSTERNLNELPNLASPPFSFAIISDTHDFYDSFETAVNNINQQPNLSFAFHLGDMTMSGFLKEFERTYKRLEKLNIPYLTVIGNHDCLISGQSIYTSMFGPCNYTFIFANIKFVVFNDNIWERNNTAPDFTWLRKAVENSSSSKIIVLAHISPFSDQMIGTEHSTTYRDIIENNNVMLSIHGHDHRYYYGNHYGNATPYLIAPEVKQGYLIVSIAADNNITVNHMN